VAVVRKGKVPYLGNRRALSTEFFIFLILLLNGRKIKRKRMRNRAAFQRGIGFCGKLVYL
jgi:hypothetical protein